MRRITLDSDFAWGLKQFSERYATREELAEAYRVPKADVTTCMAQLPGDRMIEVYQGAHMTYAIEREAVPELRKLMGGIAV